MLRCVTLISLILTQIYVEVPRARLTMELARIKESQDNISEAADVLQELQVREPLNFKGLLGWVSFKGEGGGRLPPLTPLPLIITPLPPTITHLPPCMPMMVPLTLSMPMMVPLTPLTSQYAYDDIPYSLTSHNDSLTSQYAYDGTPYPLTSQYAYDDIPYPLTSHNDSLTSQYAYDGTPYPPYLSVCL